MKHDCVPILRHAGNLQSHDQSTTRAYFDLHTRVLGELPYSVMDQVVQVLVQAYDNQKTVYLFGNGGSAALASHFACDLGKGTLRECTDGKRFKVLALTDNIPLMTAWANDSSYEDVFSEQLHNFVGPGDVAFAISASGNSSNVLRALRVSRASGAINLGLTGYSGGKMKALCDYCIIVPSDNMQVIEDFHLSAAHALFARVCQCIAKGARVAAAAGSTLQSD
jgi:D-sedoheptulose 7-phosphate isomerase